MSHERWKEIADRLPEGLRADWQKTNHFELSTLSEPFWVEIDGLSIDDLDYRAETGQRIGAVLDAAAEFKAMFAEIERLRLLLTRTNAAKLCDYLWECRLCGGPSTGDLKSSIQHADICPIVADPANLQITKG